METRKQTTFSSYGSREKDRESLVECGVRGIPVLEMPHYPWHTDISRHRYTAHTQPCTHSHRITNCMHTANQSKNTSSPLFMLIIKWNLQCTTYYEHLQLHLPCRFISQCSQQRLQTWLTFGYELDVIITCSLPAPGSSVVRSSVITVSMHTAIIYLIHNSQHMICHTYLAICTLGGK